ncbi:MULTISPECIES: hypothetical protein [Bradyrhizobium]|jgi:hypothetical protein|uniref:hypothetical protein n=1 Tax=Bradyrhizobium TaxID=374 RepID=UPI001BA5CA80|nr:hypothetical protein [Bradyrhizobium japonicum]MBR0914372.1 hypothetical protein [Bradyrhizobium japonicum]MCP1768611.1 hypothetical protein [Bradyrhizobium japonicum]MCP1794281.1 hypothetical protein [Bradyrhizobium japonicum]MCP1810963.1 hypothetical protein [Bradyrhizobium japonicum]MCP1821184.1 hypothetical protein [Bradyrhizobium japonicum]
MPFAPVVGGAVPYLIESQRRVISHCERLLPASDLAPEDRARLMRLRNDAEAQLARLTYAEAA